MSGGIGFVHTRCVFVCKIMHKIAHQLPLVIVRQSITMSARLSCHPATKEVCMCKGCGCLRGKTTATVVKHEHEHTHGDVVHSHPHDHDKEHTHDGAATGEHEDHKH